MRRFAAVLAVVLPILASCRQAEPRVKGDEELSEAEFLARHPTLAPGDDPDDTVPPPAPPQPREGRLALARYRVFSTGRERRTLHRVSGDTTGNALPANEYGYLTLDGTRLLAGRIGTGSGTGFWQTAYVLLPAGDTLGTHVIWRALASERWYPGGPPPNVGPEYHIRGCLWILGDTALVYARAATPGTPPDTPRDSLSRPPGVYRLRHGRMRRVAAAPARYARQCIATDDPDPV